MKNKILSKNILIKLAAAFAFIIIITMPQTAFKGALSGLNLWANIILPGLFPAMIISSCLLSLFPFGKSVSYLYIITTGIFCGYPIGSILCSNYNINNKDETFCERIMAYINISSPSFVMNYILSMTFAKDFNPVLIIICIYLPVAEMLLIQLFIYKKEKPLTLPPHKTDINPNNIKSMNTGSNFNEILDNSIWTSINNVLKLGGYIVLFACICQYIIEIGVLDELFTSILCSVTEITNGISLVDSLCISSELKMVIILTSNAFGGLSTIMQTMGMINKSSLSIKKYIYHKIIFALVTMANTIFMIYV
ncbi:MAG: hypothetical protein ACLSW1_01325 [Lachnospira sp.]